MNILTALACTFAGCDVLLIVFWAVACIATVVLVAHHIYTFLRYEGHDKPEAPEPAHHRLLSPESAASFFVGFGWTGVLLYNQLDSKEIIAVIALAVGVAFMFLSAYLIKHFLRIAQD